MENGAKILVVDDNYPLRLLLSKMLSRLGYEVSSANSGENGLRVFLKNRFDMVFRIMKCPGLMGSISLAALKKCSPHTPVVIMTGVGREAVLFRNSAAVDKVISKPFILAEFDETIWSLSGRAFCE